MLFLRAKADNVYLTIVNRQSGFRVSSTVYSIDLSALASIDISMSQCDYRAR